MLYHVHIKLKCLLVSAISLNLISIKPQLSLYGKTITISSTQSVIYFLAFFSQEKFPVINTMK